MTMATMANPTTANAITSVLSYTCGAGGTPIGGTTNKIS